MTIFPKTKAVTVACRVCEARKIVRHGKQQGEQRYGCRVCGRMKVMRGNKDQKAMQAFFGDRVIHYDFFGPRKALDGETPAEVAGTDVVACISAPSVPHYLWHAAHERI